MIIIALVTLGITDSWIILASGTIYLLGVQGTTVAVHLPLNNYIQKLDVEKITSPILAEERSKFEKKWYYFNNIRTGISFSVVFVLILILAVG